MTASVSSLQITTIAHCDLLGSEQSHDGEAKISRDSMSED
jgi:hypothetical protein